MGMTREQMIDRLIDKIYAMSLGKIDIRSNREKYKGMSASKMSEDLYSIHERAFDMYAKENGYSYIDCLEGVASLTSIYAPYNFENGNLPSGWEEHIENLETAGLSYMIDAYVAGVPVEYIIAGDEVFETYRDEDNPFYIP